MNLTDKHNNIRTNELREELVQATEEPGVFRITSYSGADIMLLLNGRIIGEAQAIHYKENLTATDKAPFEGHVEVAIFNQEPPIRQAIRESGDEQSIVLLFANEYGDKMSIRFEGLRFTERLGSFSIDEVVSTEKYFFECDDMVFDIRDWELRNGDSDNANHVSHRNVRIVYRD